MVLTVETAVTKLIASCFYVLHTSFFLRQRYLKSDFGNHLFESYFGRKCFENFEYITIVKCYGINGKISFQTIILKAHRLNHSPFNALKGQWKMIATFQNLLRFISLHKNSAHLKQKKTLKDRLSKRVQCQLHCSIPCSSKILELVFDRNAD